jgi:predicted SnoaL-like aldol condensation-catalyzing enzyme
MAEKELQAAASGFLDTAFNLGEPETAVSEHVGDKFVQHNPLVADGAAAFIMLSIRCEASSLRCIWK